MDDKLTDEQIAEDEAQMRMMTKRERESLDHKLSCPMRSDPTEDRCTCGLKWRNALQTEQTMHAAWRKRAEESEAELAALRASHTSMADVCAAAEAWSDAPCDTVTEDSAGYVLCDAVTALRAARGETT